MKLKNKAIITSSLILALSLSIVNPAKASDENETSSNVSMEENSNELKDVKEKDPIYSEIKLYVKNRRVKDWLKEGSYYKIEGQDAQKFQEVDDIEKYEIHDNVIPGKKQKIEIIDGKDGKVYAEGEINVIADAKNYHKMDVEIIPKIPIKTRKMTLLFKDKKNEGRPLPSGKNYVFVDGKFIGEYNGTNYSIEDFEYETGKKFKIEFRRTDKADSELLASIEDEMPEDGKLVDSKSKDVYLRFPTDPKEEKNTSTSKEKNGKKDSDSSNENEEDKKGSTESSNVSENEQSNPDSNQSNPSSNDNTGSNSNDNSNNNQEDSSNPSNEDNKDKISDKSFKTRQEAIDAAKKEMQKDTKWKSFYLIKQEDGTYKYGLSEKEDKNNPGTEIFGKNQTIKPKKITSSTKSAKKAKSPINVKTGVNGLGAIFGVLGLSIIGFFATKHKK